MAVLTMEDFQAMKPGTKVWSVMAGRIVECTFHEVMTSTGLWDNFKDVGISISNHGGLLWGDEWRDMYLDEYEARDVARKLLIQSRRRELDAAQAEFTRAAREIKMPVFVQIDLEEEA